MSTTNRPSEPYLDETSSPDPTSRPWWRTPVFAGVLMAAVIIGAGAWIVYGLGETPGMATGDMAAGGDMGEMGDAPRVPPVFGYYAGEEVFFIHTEVSDEEIGGLLEGMMGSPVPIVPSLADIPDEALSAVYVFTNGVKPDDTPVGPLGFQPDVFATAPGDEDYTPLRRLVLATWVDEDDATLLRSAADIEQAQTAGELTLEPDNVVINAPMLTWPGGER